MHSWLFRLLFIRGCHGGYLAGLRLSCGYQALYTSLELFCSIMHTFVVRLNVPFFISCEVQTIHSTNNLDCELAFGLIEKRLKTRGRWVLKVKFLWMRNNLRGKSESSPIAKESSHSIFMTSQNVILPCFWVAAC